MVLKGKIWLSNRITYLYLEVIYNVIIAGLLFNIYSMVCKPFTFIAPINKTLSSNKSERSYFHWSFDGVIEYKQKVSNKGINLLIIRERYSDVCNIKEDDGK